MKEQYHSNWNSTDTYAKNKIVFLFFFSLLSLFILIFLTPLTHVSFSLSASFSLNPSLSLSLSLSLSHTHTHTQATDLHHSNPHSQSILPSANLTIVSASSKATHHDGGFVLNDSLHSHFSSMVVIGGLTLVFGC